MTLAMLSREEKTGWACEFPVLAQRREQFLREHDVAVLVTLASPNVDDTSLRVYVRDLQPTGFGNPHASGVDGHQHDTVLGVPHRGEKLFDLSTRQDIGQLGPLPPVTRDRRHLDGTLERDRVEELDRRMGLPVGLVTEFPLVEKM